MTTALTEQPRTKQAFRLGALELPSRYFLAPLAGYTNLPLRSVVRELGGLGLATTDLVNARALLQKSKKTLELIATNDQDRPVAFQIYGSDPQYMAEAAQWLADYGASVIDINMGCPVNKITKNGGGSAMMCNRNQTIGVVEAVVQAIDIPVTVKMRLGWDDTSWTAPEFARAFEQVGVAGVIIHGRTREQGFSGTANLDGIKAVVDAVETIPVIGNGDVRSIADADRMYRHTGCAGISIGRGALLNPWIFQQLVRWEDTGDPGEPAGYFDRLDLMARHFHRLLDQRGDRFACVTFRKVANWYCKVMKPGREIQQQLVNIESVATFNGIVETLRERGEPENWRKWGVGVDQIAVPKGPISHW
ncbi:MAG: tRNA dihydrouridine synthase DusB [Gemmataceae bacterium]